MAEQALNLPKPSAAANERVMLRAIQASGGFGRDVLAIIILLLISITYHIQNPLLQFDTQFGRAWRNASLQPVLVLGLALVVGLFLQDVRATRTGLGKTLTAGLLSYVGFVLLAILAQWHLLGNLLGIPAEIFLEAYKGEELLPALETAVSLSNLWALSAVACLVVLWSPWARLSIYLQAIRKNAPVLAVAVLVLIGLELAITLFQIPQFFLPKPSTIASTFAEIYPRLVTVSWNTFQNAVWGFIVGCGLGFLTGMVSARFTGFSSALLPLAIALNSVPIIAFAPIINNWFGALNPSSKIAIVAIMTYFPAMISTVRGLNSVTPLQIELMTSYAATQLQIFSKLRLPASLPFVFSALKVGTTASMIGAIVSEYFGGTTQGLGYRIREDAANFKYPEAWAAIIVASLLGILFYVLVSAVESRLMPWHRDPDEGR